MGLPALSGTGRLTAPPEMRFTQSGMGVCTLSLAFNSRRKTDAGWEDGDVFYIRATAFRELAEHIVETLDKGDEVNVIGRMKTDQWERDGEKRSAPSLLIDAIGPNLRFATAKVNKADRGEQGPKASSGASTDDPWGSAPPATGGGFADDPPPF